MQSQEEVEQLREEFNTQQLNRANAAAAQAGYILSVELENFLCHESCKIEFGSRINFLTGANGSGKSAILAAISLGLGGTTSAAVSASSYSETPEFVLIAFCFFFFRVEERTWQPLSGMVKRMR